MRTKAQIQAYSIGLPTANHSNPCQQRVLGHFTNNHLITFYLTMPRFILAEFNTHRCLSRSAESSRAISVERRIQMVMEEPFVPYAFGRNCKGMSSVEVLSESQQEIARNIWLTGRDGAIATAQDLLSEGVHKQQANRVLEPYCYVNVIATGTLEGWFSFLKLRLQPTVQPEMYVLAGSIAKELNHYWEKLDCLIQFLKPNEWHIPFPLYDNDSPEDNLVHSTACCARVSYGNAMIDADHRKDMTLYDQLKKMNHAGPFEHQARVPFASSYHTISLGRNFGFQWNQYRAVIEKSSAKPYQLEDMQSDLDIFHKAIDNREVPV